MKELSEMTIEEMIDYWSGYLLIEIGRGKFREAVGTLLICTMTEASRDAEKKAKKARSGK